MIVERAILTEAQVTVRSGPPRMSSWSKQALAHHSRPWLAVPGRSTSLKRRPRANLRDVEHARGIPARPPGSCASSALGAGTRHAPRDAVDAVQHALDAGEGLLEVRSASSKVQPVNVSRAPFTVVGRDLGLLGRLDRVEDHVAHAQLLARRVEDLGCARPAPTESMAMTEPTPKIIPSIVRQRAQFVAPGGCFRPSSARPRSEAIEGHALARLPPCAGDRPPRGRPSFRSCGVGGRRSRGCG